MLARSLVALVVLVTLASPVASAFANSQDEVTLAYKADEAPLVITLGQLDAAGVLRDTFFAASMNESRIEGIASLTLGEFRNGTPSLTEVNDATVVVHSGALVWIFQNGTASLNASTTYGFGMALPRSPFNVDQNSTAPALLIVAPRIEANVAWLSGQVLFTPIEARVSVLDASGRAVDGWDHRLLNEHTDIQNAQGSGNGQPPSGDTATFTARGPFQANLVAQTIAGGLDERDPLMRLGVVESGEPAFLEAVGVLARLMDLISQGSGGGNGGGPPPDGSSGGQNGGNGDPSGGNDGTLPGAVFAPDNGRSTENGGFGADALSNLEALAPMLNGAVLVLNNGGLGGEEGGEPSGPATATRSKLGDDDLHVDPFALMRSKDLALAWGDGEVSVTGTSAMTLTRDGVSTSAPLVVGLVPILSVILWVGAVGAVVFFFVKRPPKSDGKWSLRILSLGIWLVVLVLVAWWWDHSFAQTFGTSILTILKTRGVAGTPYSQLALVFGLETIPWTLCAILFALPVRIMLGIALRYRGEGSSFKRVASAGGLVSLAIFGPLYALWIVNVLAQQIVSALSGGA